MKVIYSIVLFLVLSCSHRLNIKNLNSLTNNSENLEQKNYTDENLTFKTPFFGAIL